MGVTVDPKTGNPQGNVRDGPEIPEQLHPGAGDHLDPVRGEPADPAEHRGELDGGDRDAAGGRRPEPVGLRGQPAAGRHAASAVCERHDSGAAATGNIRSPYSSTTATGTTALQNNSAAVASTTTSLDNALGTHLASTTLTALSGQVLTVNGNTITFDGGTTVVTAGSNTTIGLGAGTTATVAGIISAIRWPAAPALPHRSTPAATS